MATEHVIYVDSTARDTNLYPNSNSFVVYLTNPIRNVSRVELVSCMLPGIASSQFVTLDIIELRTPTHQNANKLLSVPVSSGNSLTTTSVTNFAFATIPIKVSATTEFYNQNYLIKTEYPSRLDRVDKLTISWSNPDGTGIPELNIGPNKFLLRFHTVDVPVAPERPDSLPPPVEWKDTDDNQMILFGILLIGLLLIALVRKKS